jgi:hypothetical protein
MVAMKPYEGLSETGGESNFQKASKPSHEQKAVLTNGFIKKSQKTPKAEKELAKKYKADYERNKKSQPEYSEKTCTGIRDAIKAGICSDANKK